MLNKIFSTRITNFLLLISIFWGIPCQLLGIQSYACKQNGKTIYQPFPCANTTELPAAVKQHTQEQDLITFSKQGNEALVYKLLTMGVSPNATDEQGKTPLLYALEQQHYNIASMLIAAKANTNYAEPTTGNTALLLATFANKTKPVKLLLQANANANLANYAGMTPLIAALENKNPAIIKLLLQHKANVNQLSRPKDQDLSSTPLIHFSTYGEQDIIITLLKLGAEINLANEKKIAPLTAAALVGNVSTVELLLSAGADPKLLTQEPQLWEYVKIKNNPQIAKLIEEKVKISLTKVNK